MSYKLNQASDNVIESVLKKHNSRVREYTTYGKIKPYFTREYGNLMSIKRFKLSGYRNKTISISKKRNEKVNK